MFKRFIIIILGLCYLSNGRAQSIVSTQKEWASNRLTWADFEGESDPTLPHSSLLVYHIGQKQTKMRLHDTVVTYTQVYAVVNKALSWVTPEGKTNDNLFYNQTLFDLVALSVRKLQKEIDFSFRYNDFVNVYLGLPNVFIPTPLKSLDDRIQLFQTETQNGADKGAVSKWSKIIQAELQKTDNSLTINKLPIKKLKMSFYIGMSNKILQGTLRPYFANHLIGLSFGIELFYSRHALMMDTGFGTTCLKKNFHVSGMAYPEGLSINHTSLQTTYGYALLDGTRWRFTPHVGVGVVNLNETVGKDAVPNPNRFKNHYLNVTSGFCVDYKLAKYLDIRNRTYSEYTIKARFAAIHLNYQPNFQGLCYMNSLSLCAIF